MNRTIVERQPGYLLHSRPYRDSSALLEIWSRDHGRVGLVARGARRAKSPWRGLLDNFQPLSISWGGKGELKTLRGLESGPLMTPPVGEALAAAYYINELLLRTCMRQDPHPGLYARYTAMLEVLATDQPFEPQLRYFELQLLNELGYGADFYTDCHGDELLPSGVYQFVADQGAVPLLPRDTALNAGDQRDDRTREPVGEKVTGRLLMALAQEQLEDDQLMAAKRLMRVLLRPHLGNRPLESRRLWAVYSKLGKTDAVRH